jgi:hypothetical protein
MDYNNLLHLSIDKPKWTELEDLVLKKFMEEKRPDKELNDVLPHKTRKQCLQRWNNNLDPALNYNKMTSSEIKKMYDLHELYGNKWSIIARLLNRSPNTIKNYWYCQQKKKVKINYDESVDYVNNTQQMKKRKNIYSDDPLPIKKRHIEQISGESIEKMIIAKEVVKKPFTNDLDPVTAQIVTSNLNNLCLAIKLNDVHIATIKIDDLCDAIQTGEPNNAIPIMQNSHNWVHFEG